MEIIRLLFTFIVLCVVQALVLNRVNLFGCATPLLYIYFIMSFRRGYPKWGVLLWSFALGLCVDVFSNTPGVAASSATFLGLIQPYVFELFVQRDSPDDMKPAIRSLGMARYVYYTAICVFAFCLVFFSVEAFSFFNWLQWAKNIGGSMLLTSILIIAIDNVGKK